RHERGRAVENLQGHHRSPSRDDQTAPPARQDADLPLDALFGNAAKVSFRQARGARRRHHRLAGRQRRHHARPAHTKGPLEARRSYWNYYNLLDTYDKQWFGSDELHRALAGEKPSPDLNHRAGALSSSSTQLEATLSKLPWPQNQFFFDHVVLPLRFDQRPG